MNELPVVQVDLLSTERPHPQRLALCLADPVESDLECMTSPGGTDGIQLSPLGQIVDNEQMSA